MSLQKRLNRSRFRLGADSCGSTDHVLDGLQIPQREGALLKEDMYVPAHDNTPTAVPKMSTNSQ